MKAKKVVALLMTSAMLAGLLAGCSRGGTTPVGGTSGGDGGNSGGGDGGNDGGGSAAGDILDVNMFIAMPGSEINAGNDIQEIIAEKTGVRVKETWLTGQTAAEAVGTIIASGDIPELIDGGDGMVQLYESGLLIAWDDYLDKYPNLKEMYSDEEWDRFRQDDGKIYWANIFQNSWEGKPMGTTHNDEAFWIQVRVLEDAGYPKVQTLDDYFDVISKYLEKHPTMDDGVTNNIGYTCLTEDWRYFCIENAGQFLDGYPNDGSVIVNLDDPANPKIEDYNTTETTKEYLRHLNQAYKDGIMDKEFATMNYDEYIAKLSTGAVLGMCDQWWDFAFTVNDALKQQGLDMQGCNYVPLGLTIKPGMEQMWHTYSDTQNISSGVGVTTSNADPDRIFAFLNQLLDQDIHDLRMWGVEGVDYLVDENGLFYRTQEMRDQCADTSYQASHLCGYSYLPQWGGMSRDGKNCMSPSEQPSEFKSGLAEPLRKCLDYYGAGNYVDMIGSVRKEVGPWFPMYSHSNNMTNDTPGGVAWGKMGQVKHEYLPKLVMSSNFDSFWDEYMKAYNATNPQDFLDEMQVELDRRAGK